MRNKFDKRDSLELGTSAQEQFQELAVKRGWHVTRATKEQDIDEHWDYLIKNSAGQEYKVDVKARKRISRWDESVQEDWVWVELHGVRQHDAGWLFGGTAELIAFEKKNCFVLITKSALQEIVKEYVTTTEEVSSAERAKYKIYSRPGRHDKLSLVEMKHIEANAWEIWKK